MEESLFGPDYETLISGVYDFRKAVLYPGITDTELSRRIKELLKVLNDNVSKLFHVEDEVTVAVNSSASPMFIGLEQRILFMILFMKYSRQPEHHDSSSEDGIESRPNSTFDAKLLPEWDDVRFIEEWVKVLLVSTAKGTAHVNGQKDRRSHAEAAHFIDLHLRYFCSLLFEITGDDDLPRVAANINSYSTSGGGVRCTLKQILPPVYGANFYYAYFEPSLARCLVFYNSNNNDDESGAEESIKEERVAKLRRFYDLPERRDLFLYRHDKVLHQLGWRHKTLEQCCEEIPIRASLSEDSPFELLERVENLWHLLDTARVFSIDDAFLTIYVFADEINVYYEQLMRLFYLLNRIREIMDSGDTWEAILASGHYGQFLKSYAHIYTEMHQRFEHLCRILDSHSTIVKLTVDEETGAVTESQPAAAEPEITAKLQDLCLYMTCPLALMDTRLRLYFQYEQAPSLFNGQSNLFIFTLSMKRTLPQLDFIAADREYFAEHIADMYTCLDRHFCQFHPLKKDLMRYEDDTLPPAYSNFAKTPPLYTTLYIPEVQRGIQFNAAPGVMPATANNRPTVNPMRHMVRPVPRQNDAPFKMPLKMKLFIVVSAAAFVLVCIVLFLDLRMW